MLHFNKIGKIRIEYVISLVVNDLTHKSTLKWLSADLLADNRIQVYILLLVVTLLMLVQHGHRLELFSQNPSPEVPDCLPGTVDSVLS